MAKVQFLGPDMDIEMGAVIYMYLKHSPDYIESKYIWIHMCGQVGPIPCYFQSEVVYTYQVLDL